MKIIVEIEWDENFSFAVNMVAACLNKVYCSNKFTAHELPPQPEQGREDWWCCNAPFGEHETTCKNYKQPIPGKVDGECKDCAADDRCLASRRECRENGYFEPKQPIPDKVEPQPLKDGLDGPEFDGFFPDNVDDNKVCNNFFPILGRPNRCKKCGHHKSCHEKNMF